MSTRWTRVMAAAGLAVSSIFAAAPAHADECAPLDVSCAAGDVVDGAGGVVEDTVDTVSDTVDPIVEETTNTVDKLLGGGQNEPPAGGGTGDGGGDAGGGHRGGRGNGQVHRGGTAHHSADAPGLTGLGIGRQASARTRDRVQAVHRARRSCPRAVRSGSSPDSRSVSPLRPPGRRRAWRSSWCSCSPRSASS